MKSTVSAVLSFAILVTAALPGAEAAPPAKVVKALGTIEPATLVDVGAQVAGRITKTETVDFGAAVVEGSVLAQIDDTLYKLAAARAKADLQRAEAALTLARAKVNLAEQELKRAEKREEAKAADAADVELAKTVLEVAKATVLVEQATVSQCQLALAKAEADLGYCTIRSPISGIVVDRRCNVGQYVVASLESPSLFLLASDLKKMEIWASVREADIGQVTVGQLAQFTTEAYPGKTFQGKVAAIRLNAANNKGVVTYTVVIKVDNNDLRLLPYLTAEVSIEVGNR